MRYLLLSLLMVLNLPLGSLAGYREEFEREFLSKPWAGDQVEEDACIACHVAEKMDPRFKNIPQSWKMSIHYQHNVSCHDCHGGDPKDAEMAMSRQRGFVGTPKYAEVPEFCGKCHVGILKNYLESGHGKALKSTGKGPNCVTCHGSHKEDQYVKKASIEIINERLCSKCHSYERAKIMKQALFLTEKKMGELEEGFSRLKAEGVYIEEEEKGLFNIQAEFRTLFHTVDVSLVKERTDEFEKKLEPIDTKVKNTFSELRFRRNFSAFILLLFAGMGIVVFILSKPPKE